MTKIKKFWNGKLSLAESFWIWMVLVNLGFKFVMVLFGSFLFLSYVIIISQISWGIFSVIGTWRSATNYIKKNKKVYWGYLAKVSVVGYAIEALVFIYILLVPVLHEQEVKNKKELQKITPESKIVEDIFLECNDDYGGVITIIFNDKSQTLEYEGESTIIQSWSDNYIEFSKVRYSNVLKKNVTDTYKLNRISGSLDITSSSVDGNIRCYQTTKLKAF